MRFKNTSLDASVCRRRPTEMMAWYSDDVDTHLLVGLSIKNFLHAVEPYEGHHNLYDRIGRPLTQRQDEEPWLLECEEKLN